MPHNQGSILGRDSEGSLDHCIQTSSGAHSAYLMGKGGPSLGCFSARAQR